MAKSPGKPEENTSNENKPKSLFFQMAIKHVKKKKKEA